MSGIKKNHLYNNIILLTACISPGDVYRLKVKDPTERLKDYLMSLLKWIIYSNVSVLIFCENSNYNYNYSYIIEFAKLFDKILEVLIFEGNKESYKYGKGYGEGEIIKYALSNSKYLDDDTNFYKVTGGIFVRNFDLIAQKHINDSNVFNRTSWRKCKTVDTRFYKVNVRFYKENLIEVHKNVRDTEGYYLEHAFMDSLKNKNVASFKVYPLYEGRSRSTGLEISDSTIKFHIKNILSKLGFYKIR